MGICHSTCCGGRASPTRRLPRRLLLTSLAGRARDGLYEPVLADSEREAVADLLQYLENVC